MKDPMSRLCAMIYGADDGLSGFGGLEELALLQLERLLELGKKLKQSTDEQP